MDFGVRSLDANLLASVMRNTRVWGLNEHKAPTRKLKGNRMEKDVGLGLGDCGSYDKSYRLQRLHRHPHGM